VTATRNRQIVLAARPVGLPEPGDFRLVETPIPEPAPGEMLVRARYLSLDPYMRGRMSDARSYARPVGVGEVMVGATVGEVIRSRHPDFAEGDVVEERLGWQEYGLSRGREARKVDPRLAPISTALGILGMPGLTAYFGLLDVARPKPGETVVVSAASGAVGAVVGQIAKLAGCRVVGLAGSRPKVDYIVGELSFDAGIDYRAVPDLDRALAEACPRGIDVYFDNVGGEVFEKCLFAMNNYGRIACCGSVSQYDGAPAAHGPRGIPGLIVVKRLEVRGFIYTDYRAKDAAALSELKSWVDAGKLKVREDILTGLEKAPEALVGLLAGENVGKRMVRVS
jgi:NADPH-dependent curcumin reductase CurA